MKTIKRITSDTISEFAQKIEHAKENFIPMLPFVKMPLHDFDRYKSYSDKGIYLIDYIGDEYCLYHLYHLSEGDDTLRATLILPSNWDKRFEIIEQSIPNIKEWFVEEDDSKKFIIQSLEYGEIEYYPTLSHYLIPTIVRNGYGPKYRMYMKRDGSLPLPQVTDLDEGLSETNYSLELLDDITNFYYASTNNYRYFTNCTHDEFLEMLEQDFTIRNSKFIIDDQGNIVAGIIVTQDSEKVWIDNFTVSPEYNNSLIGEHLLSKTIWDLSNSCPDETLYIYLNRDCYDAISACEINGFVPFEFWTDMIFER
ncbi:hypothetical protein J2T12_001302 [Paenibacillus anaericanus]|uniref:hypothetical protein n=1 Tax=Paenibacillus anaericanus TaxID=170367 RepID=UPI00278AEAB5|nr:hypothetical protein [Paenibacillus anaericanus]MDQ0087896.1 hypothetical protein [Paenibacillus anaericanus]